MAEKKQPAKKPAPKVPARPVKDGPHRKQQEAASDLAKAILPTLAKRMSSKEGVGPLPEAGTKKLSKQEVDAIRLLAVSMAGPELAEDAVLICNPVSEPSSLPLSELLYDKCRWCEVDIYYDRMMPSRPDLMRVCIRCGIMLVEAEKKGGN